jgi:hypothetical protein
MDSKLPDFISMKGDSAIYSGDGEFIFYVPEKFFDLNVAFYAGEYINILGVMNYSISKNGSKGKLKDFIYPTRFLTKPYKIDKLKDVKLIATSKSQDYRALRYKNGDAIIVDINVPEDIKNVEDFVNLFVITGNIPNTIPYDKLQDYFIQNIKYNGNNYNICLQIFGIVISELCRSTKDINTPFRLANESDMTNYNPISIKALAKIVSAYSSITSENIDDAIMHAAMNDKKVISPLERVLTGE